MKILVMNGSPKGNRSNSMQLTTAFLDGIKAQEEAEIEILNLNDLNIKPCLGCFCCWTKTPGKCAISDDMAAIIEKELAADTIIWSFPLYYFGLPGPMKALLDRHLPMVLPFMAKEGESGGHNARYDMSGKKHVFISTCGFYTSEGNYDALNLQLDRCYGNGKYETLYCGQGELFSVPELRERANKYLELVKKAGQEFSVGGISAETKEDLSQLLFEREAFETMADASWEISQDEATTGGTNQEKEDTVAKNAFLWTKQMAALYNSGTYNGKDRVVEMCYTDIQRSFQMVLGKDGSKVLDRDFLPFTTKIETPLTVWHDIADGKLSGQDAMMQHLYRVEGDFELMLKWDEVFGTATTTAVEENIENTPSKKTPSKKTNMSVMLFPWIVLWVALPINGMIGGCVGILACALLPFASLKWKTTIFEYISILICTGISLLAVLGAATSILTPVQYLLFGLMWLVTVFLKNPLTAYYSLNDYGGDRALNNGLFMRTNSILTACWAALYLVTPIWTYFIMLSDIGWISGIVNSLLPALLGIFTAWFEKWYPPHYASK